MKSLVFFSARPARSEFLQCYTYHEHNDNWNERSYTFASNTPYGVYPKPALFIGSQRELSLSVRWAQSEQMKESTVTNAITLSADL